MRTINIRLTDREFSIMKKLKEDSGYTNWETFIFRSVHQIRHTKEKKQ